MDLIYKNYRLRKPEKKDAQGFVNISSQPEVMLYYGEGDGICRTREEGLRQVVWARDQFEKNAGRWIIVEEEKDEYIGDLGLSEFQDKHRRGELGYRLMKEYWGQGVVSAFLGMVRNWAFEQLNYNRIEALVDVRNPGSKRVLIKNGFTMEGVLRDYEFEFDHFVDLEMYSILKKDLNGILS